MRMGVHQESHAHRADTVGLYVCCLYPTQLGSSGIHILLEPEPPCVRWRGLPKVRPTVYITVLLTVESVRLLYIELFVCGPDACVATSEVRTESKKVRP